MEPKECECGLPPEFEVCRYDNGTWYCNTNCDHCDHRVCATGPAPQAALDAAIKEWNHAVKS